MDKNKTKSKKTIKLTEEQFREVIELATETGIQTYLGQFEEEKKKTHDRMLHNTKKLLENYRGFSQYSDKAVYNLYKAISLDEETYDVLDLMEKQYQRPKTEMTVESIEKGVARTRTMMAHVNRMLEIYKDMCNKSPYPEDMRRYRVIKALYLDEKKLTFDEIAEKECVNKATVYRDRDNAVRSLTVLIFGIDGIKI